MPKPADQPGAVPYGGPGFNLLPVVRGWMAGSPTLTSAWEFTAEEVAEINRSGRIFLTIMGEVQPPVLLTTTPPYAAPADGEAG